jgi:ADP-ribosylglycohydrolase
MAIKKIERYRGCLLGLAIGDALGTTLEFKPPGSFTPITDMIGGGPFNLAPGQWTDDTSMALCLAESLIECKGFDPKDQMERYIRWWKEGHLSSTGACFDIGNTTRTALSAFLKTGNPFSGPTDSRSAGNGSLMRLAPLPMFYAAHPEEAIERSGESSKTTHGAPVAVDACCYFGALIVGALKGEDKETILTDHYCPDPGYWQEKPLAPEIAEIAAGSFKYKHPPEIRGSGYVVQSLEAALWAFHNSESFQEGCLMAVNLGDDADTTGAIYGQLAGAYYGQEQISNAWMSILHEKDILQKYAEMIYVAMGYDKQ